MNINGLCMLPKDVQLIVYRYIHRCKLNDVHKEYAAVSKSWSNEYSTYNGIYNNYKHDKYYLLSCNYRIISEWSYEHIFPLYCSDNGNFDPIAKLPKNYVHAVLYNGHI